MPLEYMSAYIHIAIYQSRCLTSISGFKEIMKEVSKREKEAGIIPDPDIDTYMKVSTS